ncbi:hypothetical protein RvY_16456 [Ramazzottius varieornatus]|uniref:Odorant receptor n=1 Tax=Ramazzottius varieornatus TaxID=947166 RepID=A0A1D1VYH9_RAMVA|nr:hypothetical protein RvY_16456 [Ramazzottius varieornatus]
MTAETSDRQELAKQDNAPCVYVGIQACQSLSAPRNPAIQSSTIVRVLAGVPNFFLSLRGLLVLLYLCRKRIVIAETCSKLRALCATCIHPDDFSRRSRKWFRLNIMLTMYCISMFATMFTLSWLHGFDFEKRKLCSPYRLNPIDAAIPTWAFIVLQVLFMYYPYILSKVFLIATIVMTCVMRDCSKAINQRLSELDERAKRVSRNFRVGEEIDSLTKDLEVLIGHRAVLFQFLQQWNHAFGWILFLSYGVDVCGSAGMLAVLVSGTERSRYVVAAKLIGSVGFVTFATALYAPLALATEETFMLLASFSLLLIELLAEERSAAPASHSNWTVNA